MAASLHTVAWRLCGLTGTERGQLSLAGGRLRFAAAGEHVFDVPLGRVSDVSFPWYWFGGGVRLRAGGTAYRFTFVRPTQELGDVGDIAAGRAAGRAWKAALLPPSR